MKSMETAQEKPYRLFAQIVAGLNAAYLLGVGFLSVFAPATACLLYGVGTIDALASALVRIVGGGMVGMAVLLGAFVWRPRFHGWIAPLLAIMAAANAAGFAVVGLTGELAWSQIARSLIAQGLLTVALALFWLKSKRASS